MNTITDQKIDEKKLETFIGHVLNDFGAGFGMMLSFIGDKLGLYKAMANAGYLSSEELAKRTGTSERYVREWLINQAAGGYIEYDPNTGKYILPDEHAIALTDESHPFFVAGGFQVLYAISKAQDRIMENFLNGNGMKWREHHNDLFYGTERFFKASYLAHLQNDWLPAIDGIVEQLKDGINVADIGCGHGASTLIMAEIFPNSKFTGYDNHEPSIERANKLAKESGLKNVIFKTAAAQEFDGSPYQFITFFDCLHDMGDPIGALKNCIKVLERKGVVMAIEPMAGRTVEENLNPIGRVYTGASVLCCTPNALATGGYALGTVATDEDLRKVANAAGFSHFKRATETPFNRVFEMRR